MKGEYMFMEKEHPGKFIFKEKTNKVSTKYCT